MNLRCHCRKVHQPPAGGAGQSAGSVQCIGRQWPTISSAASQPGPACLNRFHQRLAKGCEKAREGNRSAIFRPRFAVHFNPKLTMAGERNDSKLNFKIFISLQVFDRNPQVRFHKYMVPRSLQKSSVYGLVHGQAFNNSYA